MTPKKFKLSGAVGIASGLGLEVLTMDLTKLVPDNAMTVALTGDNGAGKSTVFNLAMTPWRIPDMISDIYIHFGEKGERELEFSHGTEQYRSRIVIRQTKKTKNMKAFLHHQGPTGWEPYLMPDNTVSDGKSSTYDACLTHLLGHQSLYFLSAFRQQNAIKLSEYDDAKALMEDLLSLYEPKNLRKKTKLVAREIRRAFEATKDAAAALEEKKEQTGTLALQISTIQNETPRLVEAKTAAASAVSIAQAELTAAATAEGENVRVRKQREDVEVQLAETRRLHRAGITDIDADILKGGERLEKAKNDSIIAHGRLEARKQSVENRAFRAEQLLLRKEEIDFAAVRVDTMTHRVIPAAEKELEEIRTRVKEVADLSTKVALLGAQVNQTTQDRDNAAALCRQARTRAGYVDIVPCHGVGEYADCPALKDAQGAVLQVPLMEQMTKDRSVDLIKFDAELNEYQAKLAAAGTPSVDLQHSQTQLLDLRDELTGFQAVSALKSGLEQAQQTVNDANTELEGVKNEIKLAVASDLEVLPAIEMGIAGLKSRRAEAITTGTEAVAAVQAKLDAIPLPDADSVYTAAENSLRAADVALIEADNALDKQSALAAGTQARLDLLMQDLAAGAAILKQSRYLSDELAVWNLLDIALAGVIDLSIEAAGPTIATTANQLLHENYGPRFSLNIVTQKAQANGIIVETFDVTVMDGNTGLERSLLLKSGGEGIYMDRALTDSIALFHQDTAGVHYETAFADEADGALDAEKKSALYRMERAALEKGGFQRKWFISHDPAAWAQADFVLDLNDYRAGV